jgi:hypothetical protein
VAYDYGDVQVKSFMFAPQFPKECFLFVEKQGDQFWLHGEQGNGWYGSNDEWAFDEFDGETFKHLREFMRYFGYE